MVSVYDKLESTREEEILLGVNRSVEAISLSNTLNTGRLAYMEEEGWAKAGGM